MKVTPAQRVALIVAASLWVGGVGYGFHALWNYKATPGALGKAPAVWPSGTIIPRNLEGATLVMIAHPQCPCTRASIAELATLMSSGQGRVKAYVAFLKPSEFAEEWPRTELWRAAARISGVTPVADVDGVEAARFGGLTSGQTILYDARGKLVFHGGVTFARGHVGRSTGGTAIARFLDRKPDRTTATAVFGCSIVNANTPSTRMP